jgi:Protein of unknown function (DUF4127)
VTHVFAFLLASIVLVPLDDRPVSAQLPVMLGTIAGERVVVPPPELLGHYIQLGKPDAIIAWLNRDAAGPRDAFVISSDMLAYGGLVASRVPGPAYADAYFRLRELTHLRSLHPHAWIAAFATIMRLAPTSVPAGTSFFAAGPLADDVRDYARLPDPLPSDREPEAAALRAKIGADLLAAYVATRARNFAVDGHLLGLVADGTIDRLVLGQDDAGVAGLHVREVHELQDEASGDALAGRVSIEPGADELGMALVAHALARSARWTPRIAVRYSTASGANTQDPLEFAPIGTTIASLIDLCGGVRADAGDADIVLYVHLPKTGSPDDDAFAAAMAADIESGRSVALADLSFLNSLDEQGAFARRLLGSGLASHLDAYSSWNTDANTVGTALAEAIAAGAGRRMGTYDRLAHRTFTFMRFVDDYAFHVDVRPDLNAYLKAGGVTDHTLLQPATAAETADRNRALLWSRGQAVLKQLYPGFHIAAMTITLPWGRTFETEIQTAIAPDL